LQPTVAPVFVYRIAAVEQPTRLRVRDVCADAKELERENA